MAMHNQVHATIRGSFVIGVVGNFGQVEQTLQSITPEIKINMAAQSLYGLWIENERIMSPLHRVVDIGSRLTGIVERKLFRPVKTGSRNWHRVGGNTTTSRSSGAANTMESGVTASNIASTPVLQMELNLFE